MRNNPKTRRFFSGKKFNFMFFFVISAVINFMLYPSKNIKNIKKC